MSSREKKNKEKAIVELVNSSVYNIQELMLFKRKLAKKYQIGMLDNKDILQYFREKGLENPVLQKILKKRAVRTLSGIAPVAVLTKPYPCPGKCAYCPTEKEVPQSYLSNEPAVMRAIRCNYHPYTQVQDRLRALVINGHEPTKIELIVIGGTWSVLPEKYKTWYILNLFAAANRFKLEDRKFTFAQDYGRVRQKTENRIKQSLSLKKLKEMLVVEQKRNEKAKYKIIGLTLETRPDYINHRELQEMREFGCTRVELGVQAIDDKILKLNKRGHGVDKIIQATKWLRDHGFKITYHIMPGLPGATPVKDIKMFRDLFTSDFQPDQIKFYPTVVTRGSLMYKWWQKGKYKPYSTKVLQNLIIKCKALIPEYVRVIRLIRDIPGESIEAGNKVTNLRQVMQQQGIKCNCIRCREIKNNNFKDKKSEIKTIKYPAAGGEEYFIESILEKTEQNLLGFCRLRLPNKKENKVLSVLEGAALIRELHVYGELVSVGKGKKVQHIGLGKKMLAEAEKIARENSYEKIVIISGIGVRGYYRKMGYKLRDTYMVKKLR